MIFTRLARKNNAASTLALAVSIAAGGMVAASAFEAPAFAQKEKKSQPKYSKAFIEAYKPLETMASADLYTLTKVETGSFWQRTRDTVLLWFE